ncbi:hypothetical protein BU16DRAFT_532461 [Lophium mytilinum]|uniref:Uncharacterized protein n=1 Tax=Lophium mytilinum TaxID=390894 RepID=A0A6A6RBF4_9PEZI|nr:hypothetical protein BU16DRAFT_532461 [Lophium mytilinum]
MVFFSCAFFTMYRFWSKHNSSTTCLLDSTQFLGPSRDRERPTHITAQQDNGATESVPASALLAAIHQNATWTRTIAMIFKSIGKSTPMPDNEIDCLLQDIGQTKTLLFCRFLLSHALISPVVVRVESIERFFGRYESQARGFERDLPERETPALQEVRDACTDLARKHEEEEDQLDDNAT